MLTAQPIPSASGGEPSIHWALPVSGLALSAVIFLLSRFARKRHWSKVKAQANPAKFAAIWIDVFFQLFAALAVLIAIASLLLLYVALRPHFS